MFFSGKIRRKNARTVLAKCSVENRVTAADEIRSSFSASFGKILRKRTAEIKRHRKLVKKTPKENWTNGGKSN